MIIESNKIFIFFVKLEQKKFIFYFFHLFFALYFILKKKKLELHLLKYFLCVYVINNNNKNYNFEVRLIQDIWRKPNIQGFKYSYIYMSSKLYTFFFYYVLLEKGNAVGSRNYFSPLRWNQSTLKNNGQCHLEGW